MPTDFDLESAVPCTAEPSIKHERAANEIVRSLYKASAGLKRQDEFLAELAEGVSSRHALWHVHSLESPGGILASHNVGPLMLADYAVLSSEQNLWAAAALHPFRPTSAARRRAGRGRPACRGRSCREEPRRIPRPACSTRRRTRTCPASGHRLSRNSGRRRRGFYDSCGYRAVRRGVKSIGFNCQDRGGHDDGRGWSAPHNRWCRASRPPRRHRGLRR